jgi:type IV secretory pathway VirB3-like protein
MHTFLGLTHAFRASVMIAKMLSFLILLILIVLFLAFLLFAVLRVVGSREVLIPRASTSTRSLRKQPSSSSQRAAWMNFPESNVPVSIVEFQAIILAGYGNA